MGDDLGMIAAVCGQVCAGLVFCLAGAQKLRHPAILRGVIANYRLLADALAAPAAALLPPVEIILGVVLVTGLAHVWATVAAILLLSVFAAAMAVNLKRGRTQIDCGCNSSLLRQPLRWSLVARNGALVVLLLPSLTAPPTILGPAWWAGAGAGAAFFVLYLIVNALAALPAPGLMKPYGPDGAQT